MDWAVRGSSVGGGDIFILLNVKADPGAHPVSYSMDTGSKAV
jgi:hypothetical protein